MVLQVKETLLYLADFESSKKNFYSSSIFYAKRNYILYIALIKKNLGQNLPVNPVKIQKIQIR